MERPRKMETLIEVYWDGRWMKSTVFKFWVWSLWSDDRSGLSIALGSRISNRCRLNEIRTVALQTASRAPSAFVFYMKLILDTRNPLCGWLGIPHGINSLDFAVPKRDTANSLCRIFFPTGLGLGSSLSCESGGKFSCHVLTLSWGRVYIKFVFICIISTGWIYAFMIIYVYMIINVYRYSVCWRQSITVHSL